MRVGTAVLSLFLVVSVVAGATPAVAHGRQTTPQRAIQQSTTQRASEYDGTHVSFSLSKDAIEGYAVDGRTYFERIEVQSAGNVSGRSLNVGTDVSTVDRLNGSALSLADRSTTTATTKSDSGAEVVAHDDEHGIVVIRPKDGPQTVEFTLDNESEATFEGDSTVSVETPEDDSASVVVVGQGHVGTNGEGNVVANVSEGGLVVVHAYQGLRSAEDSQLEQLAVDGVMTSEVAVERQEGELVADVVTYDPQATVNVTEAEQDRVHLTATRETSHGSVVLVSLGDAVVDAGSDVSVAMDRVPVEEAETYAQLRSVANGGNEPLYLPTSSSNRRSTTDVAVAVNHFSTRDITIEGNESGGANADETTAPASNRDGSQEDESEEGGSGGANGENTSTESPGFGVPVGVLALLVGVGMLARRER